MQPLVTVIIPSYNHSAYIAQAIDSVLEQTYQNIEVIVVDDASADDTRQVLESYRDNPKVRYVINDVNKGQSAVFNQGLAMAGGKYICLLPSDDWYLENKIASQVAKFMESDPDVGVVYSKGYRYYIDLGKMVEVELPVHEGWILEKLIRNGNFIYPVTPMFRAECFKYAIPDERFKAEGEAIYLKLSAKFKFAFVDEFLAVMRDHSGNTGKNRYLMYSENLKYIESVFNCDYMPEQAMQLKYIPLSRLHRTSGLEFVLLYSDFLLGRKALLSAIKLNPRYMLDRRVIVALLVTFLPPWLRRKVVKLKRVR